MNGKTQWPITIIYVLILYSCIIDIASSEAFYLLMPVILNLSIISSFPRAHQGRTSLKAWEKLKNPTVESTWQTSIHGTAGTSDTIALLKQTFTAGKLEAAREERQGRTPMRAESFSLWPPCTPTPCARHQSWGCPVTAAVPFKRSASTDPSPSAPNALPWRPPWRKSTVAALGLKWWWASPWQPTARRNFPSTGHPSKGSPSLMAMLLRGQTLPQSQITSPVIPHRARKSTPPRRPPHAATPSSSSTNIRAVPPQSPPSLRFLSPTQSRRTGTVICTLQRQGVRARSWAPGSPARRTSAGCGRRNPRWSGLGLNLLRRSDTEWHLKPFLSRASRWVYRSAGSDTASGPACFN